MRKFLGIPLIYNILFLALPLVFYSGTSEIFEFNKLIIIYLATVLVACLATIHFIGLGRIKLRHTALDIPIIIFLFSQLVSTLFSIDFRTSFLGYYGRFNGGLLSTISFAILYFGFVNFMDKEKTKTALKFLLAGAVATTAIATLEHFNLSFTCLVLRGVSTNQCWVQNVQERVFGTLGQPNWLAAYLISVLPIVWALAAYSLKRKYGGKITTLWTIIGLLMFAAVLFTKSRSGLAGFLPALIVFWGIILWRAYKNIQERPKVAVLFVISAVLYFIFALSFSYSNNQKEVTTSQTSLESGGTESGEIRKIVWEGAYRLWLQNPVLGTGVETFAYSYWNTRPIAHNLTSEWEFVYNKAHNEYLNYLATTGLFGFVTYLSVCVFGLIQITKNCVRHDENEFNILLQTATLSGFISILITNFFGFSVTVVSLIFFMLPAISYSLNIPLQGNIIFEKSKLKTFASGGICMTMFYLVISIFNYWQADIIYARGINALESGDAGNAESNLETAIRTSPNESVYQIALARTYAQSAVALFENNNIDQSIVKLHTATALAEKASQNSSKNVAINKQKYQIYTDLSEIDSNYLIVAQEELVEAVQLAPSDPKIYYSLGLSNTRLGNSDAALSALNTAIELKYNYQEAYLAKAIIYMQIGDTKSALYEANSVIALNPKNEKALKILEDLKKSQ